MIIRFLSSSMILTNWPRSGSYLNITLIEVVGVAKKIGTTTNVMK